MIKKNELSINVLDFLIVNKSSMFRGEYRDYESSLCTYQYVPPSSPFWEKQLNNKKLDLPRIPLCKTSVKLYDYQQEIFDKMNGVRAGLVIGKTGSGKGHLVVAMAEAWVGKTLILLHNTTLCVQQRDRINEFSDKKSGIYYSKEKNIQNITCTTYSSFRAYPFLFNDFNQLLVDECDLAMTTRLRSLINKHEAIRKIGFTATEKKTTYDIKKTIKKGAGGQIYKEVKDRNKIDPNYINAVRKYWGYRVIMDSPDKKYALKSIYIGETKKDYKTMDYEVKEDNIVISTVPVTSKNWIMYRDALDNSNELLAEKVNFLLQNYDKKISTIAFFDRVKECERIYKYIKAKTDINCHILYGKTKEKDRQEVKKDIEKNGGLIIAHPTLVGRGFDLPRLKRGFVLFPLADKTTTEQLIGRMAREWLGENGEIFDLKIKGLDSQFKQRLDLYKSKNLIIKKI